MNIETIIEGSQAIILLEGELFAKVSNYTPLGGVGLAATIPYCATNVAGWQYDAVVSDGAINSFSELRVSGNVTQCCNILTEITHVSLKDGVFIIHNLYPEKNMVEIRTVKALTPILVGEDRYSSSSFFNAFNDGSGRGNVVTIESYNVTLKLHAKEEYESESFILPSLDMRLWIDKIKNHVSERAASL